MRPGMSVARPGVSHHCALYMSCVSVSPQLYRLVLRLFALPASFRSPCVSPLSLRLSALPASLRSPCVSPPAKCSLCPLKALSENPNRLYKLFKFSILIMSACLRTNFTDPVLNIWILFVFENLP